MGEVAQLVPVLYGIWGFHLVRGELKKSLEIGTQCLATAESSGNPPFLIAGHYTLGVTSFWTGCLQRFETEPLYRRKIEPPWADSILSSFLRLQSSGLFLRAR